MLTALLAGRNPQPPPHLGVLYLVLFVLVADNSRAQTTAPAGAGSQPAEVKLRVLADNVNIRTRADLNSMIAMQVHRDAVLNAVGRDGDWYRITPPPGAFSLVSAEYVQRAGDDAGVVAVRSGTLRVRVGSSISESDPMTHEVQSLLPNGAPVRILGQDGGWLRIVPPADVYYYVSADFVEPIGEDLARTLATAPPPAPASAPAPAAGAALERLEPAAPATRPAAAGTSSWAQRLQGAEAAVAAENAKPVLEQVWSPILLQINPIAMQREQVDVARQAESLIQRVRQAVAAQNQARAVTTATQPAAANPVQPARPVQPGKFDAEGLLRATFALPASEHGLRYKLIDPFTYKVRAYAEVPFGTGINATAAVGRYVGIRGERVMDVDYGAPLYRVSQMTVLSPERPSAPPREAP
ncbi:MAG: hypothetical protein HRF50_15435 [Phycisphaerae bacterium]|jgi:hypothetical protein